MPQTPKSKPEDNEVEDQAAAFEAQNMFRIAVISELYSSPFAQGFGNSQHLAAIWALLRHGAHQDGAHHHTKSQGGLHPAYVSFNPGQKSKHKDLTKTGIVEAALSDIFDAVCLTFH